jgi:hypothetical protein
VKSPPFYVSCAKDTSGRYPVETQAKNSSVIIPSPNYGNPLKSMEVAKYSPISLLAELNVAMYGFRGSSPTLLPAERDHQQTLQGHHGKGPL